MKKVIYLICSLLLGITFSACTIGYGVNNFQAIKTTIGGLEYNEEAKLYYYDNVNDLAKLKNSLFGEYDKLYFNENSLIIITIIDNEKNEYVIERIKNANVAIYKDMINDGELINWTLILEVNGKIKDPQNYYVTFIDRRGHSHAYIKSIIKPTCQEQGYTLYNCECGEKYQNGYVAIVECKYENGKCVWCENTELEFL